MSRAIAQPIDMLMEVYLYLLCIAYRSCHLFPQNTMDNRIDITRPLYDQSTFIGRVRHFAFVTDPRTVFSSEKQLDEAKELVELYK